MREPTDRPAPAPGGAGNDARVDVPPPTLQDRYRCVHLIANGGMASVWRARDDELARDVAVKMLHDHLATDDEFLERFRREAVAAAKLTHPHVVSIYDTGLDGRRAWLVMELIDGVTLRDLMDAQGTLEVAHAARIGEQVARGLAFAHAHGLVHRDVKPANILLGDDGSVKVTDFGIAKFAGAGADLTGTGTVLGTAAYVSPEQIRSEPLDGTCDQYALGCVLYEALTGRRPFDGTTAVETAARRLTDDPAPLCSVRPDLPAELGTVIERALAREATDRFRTADDLADALAVFAGHPEVPAPAGVPPTADAGARARGAPAGTAHASGPQGVPRPLPAAGPHAAPSQGPPPSERRSSGRRPSGPQPSQPSRRRGRPSGPRRRTGVAWLVLGVAVLAVGAAGIGLLVLGADRSPEERAQPDVELIAPASTTLFDPGGTGSESGAQLPALLDGDPTTSWESVGYNTPDFGGLKEGLGFWIDLGAPHQVESVALRTDTPGISYEIRTASEPAGTIEEWLEAGTQTDAAELSQVVFPSPVVSQYVLVWVTGDLQPDGSGRFRVRLSEVAVRGERA